MKRTLALMLACVVLAGCASESVDEASDTLPVPKGVWGKFQEYKKQLKPGEDQYFAASSTGGFAWNVSKDEAIKQCEQYSKGVSCVLFAHNDEILVPYEVK